MIFSIILWSKIRIDILWMSTKFILANCAKIKNILSSNVLNYTMLLLKSTLSISSYLSRTISFQKIKCWRIGGESSLIIPSSASGQSANLHKKCIFRPKNRKKWKLRLSDTCPTLILTKLRVIKHSICMNRRSFTTTRSKFIRMRRSNSSRKWVDTWVKDK